MSANGKLEIHGNDYSKDYSTDLIANRSLDFIDKAVEDRKEFMAVIFFINFPNFSKNV